jgi:hypothetical protein
MVGLLSVCATAVAGVIGAYAIDRYWKRRERREATRPAPPPASR